MKTIPFPMNILQSNVLSLITHTFLVIMLRGCSENQSLIRRVCKRDSQFSLFSIDLYVDRSRCINQFANVIDININVICTRENYVHMINVVQKHDFKVSSTLATETQS